jgi:hypothetical protein
MDDQMDGWMDGFAFSLLLLLLLLLLLPCPP